MLAGVKVPNSTPQWCIDKSKTSGIGKDSCVRVTLDSTFLVFN